MLRVLGIACVILPVAPRSGTNVVFVVRLAACVPFGLRIWYSFLSLSVLTVLEDVHCTLYCAGLCCARMSALEDCRPPFRNCLIYFVHAHVSHANIVGWTALMDYVERCALRGIS